MKELETLDAFDRHITQADLAAASLDGVILQALDLRERTEALTSASLASLRGAVFLGCKLSPDALDAANVAGALVFPSVPDLPYKTFRAAIYSAEELYAGFDSRKPESYEQTLDARVYNHFKATGGGSSATLLEALAQRIHDLSMTDALAEVIDGRRCVAIMGGHALGRDTAAYAQVTRIARALTRRGFFMVSGGGPGAMEATHVGAYFAPRPDEDLDAALEILAQAPSYRDAHWLSRAFDVLERFPLADEQREQGASLGVPTWLYGHEPPNPFATHIAKLFANSVREDGLVTIATYGIIFSPGSAGTIQEIFQDACQNHYNTIGIVSPMIFMGEGYWSWKKPVFPLLAHLAAGKEYGRHLLLTDDEGEVVDAVVGFAAELDG